jgi:hypothetical protein
LAILLFLGCLRQSASPSGLAFLAVYGNNNRLTAAKIIRRNGMKNWKQALLAMIAIFEIIIGFTACDNSKNDPCKCEETYGTTAHLEVGQSCNCGGDNCNCSLAEQPKDQSRIITLSGGKTLIVKGNFTDTEWNGFIGNIVSVINKDKNKWQSIFTYGIIHNNIYVILEKTTEYSNYSTVVGGDTIYINFSIVNDEDALTTAFDNARGAMSGNPNIPLVM